jgi:oligosaccharide repeat unit polymerase
MSDEMEQKTWVKKVLLLLIQITLTGAILLIYLTGTQSEKEMFLLGKWGFVTILMTVWVFISWRVITYKFISYYGIFFLIAILFHFGQSWTELLSPNSISYVNLTDFYSLKKINTAYLYSACCLMVLHTAVMLMAIIYIHGVKKRDLSKKERKPVDMNILTAFGVLLFVFSFFPKVIIDIKLYGFVSQGGYLTIYSNPLTGTVWSVFYKMAGFFYPSIYILLYCIRNKKNQWNLLFYGIIVYCLAYGFFIGNRGIMFMLIVSLILYRHFIYKKFTKKETILLTCFALLVLMLSSTIALTRIGARGSVSFGSIFKNIKGYNLVYSSISEFGGTAMSLLVGMKIIPDVLPFGNGITYLASSAVIIPDPLGLLSGLSPYVTFSGVLNNYHSGLGGSFIAEAYYNFGDYGFALMGVLGMLIGGYLIRMDLDKYRSDHSTSIIWASLMYLALLMYVRDQFYSITSGLLQYFIYPWILYWIFKKILTLNKKASLADI